MAASKACVTVDSIVLQGDTDAGVHGYGEVCPIPHYLPAYADGVAPTIQELATVLLSADPTGVGRVMEKADDWLLDHRYAKSALDIALWDLTAKLAGLPLYAIVGGQRPTKLPSYHCITCVDPDVMAEHARAAYATGIRQFQAKLGADDNWEADVARLHKVREAVGSHPLVYGDWNCGATQLDATRVGRAVCRHLDVMLEQPCRTVRECAAARHACGLPMKLDENACDADSILLANQLGCVDVIARKLNKFGGISASMRVRDLCIHLGIKMCVEGTWGSDIVTAAALHLATATSSRLVQNVCDLSNYVTPRPDSSVPLRQNGWVATPNGPGLGVSPDPEVLGTPIMVLE